MSYINLPNGIPNFKKAVISLWFRVPQKSIDAAAAAFSSDFRDVPPILNGIIPLVVMGPKGFLQPFAQENTEIDLGGGHGTFTLTTTTPTDGSLPTNPTIIGINCDPSYERPVLYVNIETSQKASVSDYQFELRDVSYPYAFTYVDVTDVFTDLTAAISGTNIYLDPSGSGADRWHHVMISIDLPTIQTHGIAVDEVNTGIDADYVDSAARLFVALDDVNYTEFDLSNFFVRSAISGSTEPSVEPNIVVPELALKVAGAEQATGFSTDYPDTAILGGIPQYMLDSPTIPCNEQPIGLPATPEFVNNIYHVEMAELQLFTGVTLDTGVEANRRVFIDFKRDAKGNPIVDKAGKMTLVPVDPTKGTKDDPRPPAERLLGKRPDVLLHTSSNWINGKNTGSTGMQTTTDSSGFTTTTEIPAGQFKRVAGINKYSGPSITK